MRVLKQPLVWLQLCFLAALFSVSVYLRSPNFNQPMGRHHEWITAHTLLTLKIWEHGGGPEHYHFSPVYIFDGPMNKNIAILGGVGNEKGDFYYVSYPPLAFILPYYVLKAFGMPMSTASILIFGYGLHFITAVLVFLLIHSVAEKKWHSSFFFPAWIGYSFYLFSAGNLWFHSNVYFVDVLMQFFLFAQLLIYLKLWRNRETGIGKFDFIALGAITFFAIYTEWLGLFLAFVFGCFLLANALLQKNRRALAGVGILFTSTILSLGLTFYQYSSISGSEEFLKVSTDKYALRSGHSGVDGSEHGFSMTNPDSYTNLRVHNDRNYRFTLQALIITGILSLVLIYFRKKWLYRDQYFILALLLGAILLHLVLFFNFNAVHDFSTLKTGSLFILLLVFSMEAILDFAAKYGRRIYLGVVVISALFLFTKLKGNYGHYITENSPVGDYGYAFNTGEFIRNHAHEDELVFVDSWILPECMYYAERNYHSKPNIASALELMREWNFQKGFFVYTKGTSAPVEAYRISISGDSTLVEL